MCSAGPGQKALRSDNVKRHSFDPGKSRIENNGNSRESRDAWVKVEVAAAAQGKHDSLAQSPG